MNKYSGSDFDDFLKEDGILEEVTARAHKRLLALQFADAMAGGRPMSDNDGFQPTVVRTERGLSVEGTRITLYAIMDYLKEDWPPKLIRQWLNLTEEQITGVMAYIQAHRAEVEAEYQEVLREAEESRRYWEERNRERFAEIAKLPPKPGQEAIRAKLQAWKARRGLA